jgi:hypothetical protein
LRKKNEEILRKRKEKEEKNKEEITVEKELVVEE